MTAILPILLLGALILVLSGRLLLQQTKGKDAEAVTIADYTRARAALESVFVETTAIKRIFAAEDLEFISRTGATEVQRFFLKERGELARQWLRMTQRQVAHLMDLHLRLAGYTYEPSPRFELALTVRYRSFILFSNILLILVWLRGPFEAGKVVGYALRVAEHFCSVFSIRHERIDPAKLAPG